MIFQEEFRKQWKKAAMKVQTINILTNNSIANIKNDSEEDENNIETNQVGFLKILPQNLSKNHRIPVN